MNAQVKLDPYVYEKLVKLANKLNIPPEKLANGILYEVLEENNIVLPEAKKLYKLIKTKYKASRYYAWLQALSLYIDAGHKIIQMIREITKDAMDIGYRLEDISLQIWEGVDRVWIKLYKTKWGTPWSHEAWIDLCENETTQVFIQSIIGSKDELGSQAKEIEEKIEEILNQVEELEEYRKLVNEIEECSYGYDIDIYPKDEDSITLNISIKTSNWRCIPSFKTIENLIHKIYNITGLETLIKERFL